MKTGPGYTDKWKKSGFRKFEWNEFSVIIGYVYKPVYINTCKFVYIYKELCLNNHTLQNVVRVEGRIPLFIHTLTSFSVFEKNNNVLFYLKMLGFWFPVSAQHTNLPAYKKYDDSSMTSITKQL